VEPASTTGQGLALAMDLFATGEDLMRQRLKRQHPELAAEDIETLLASLASASSRRGGGRCRRAGGCLAAAGPLNRLDGLLRRLARDLHQIDSIVRARPIVHRDLATARDAVP
jgi:hypothetical protein